MIYVWAVIKVFILQPIEWLFKHPKSLILVALVVGGLVGYRACNSPTAGKPGTTVTLSPAQQKAPTLQQATYALQTYSRVYYLNTFTKVSESKVILYKWYEWTGREWKYQSSTVGVPFDKAVTGDFKLFKR
jgi:hypothetical protein